VDQPTAPAKDKPTDEHTDSERKEQRDQDFDENPDHETRSFVVKSDI
jgi:hypothetical protein